MKHLTISIGLILAYLGGAAYCHGLQQEVVAEKAATREIAQSREIAPRTYDGAYFNAAYVVDTFRYADEAYYMVYDDSDANCFYEAIRLDKETFEIVQTLVNNQDWREGSFTIHQEWETTYYSINFDE